MLHELKIVAPFFRDVKEGKKLWELRYNDRDYQVGDQLLLKEYVASEHRFTGDELLVDVVYIYEAAEGDPYGLPPDWCVMSIRFSEGAEKESSYAIAQYDDYEGNLTIDIATGGNPVQLIMTKLGLTEENMPESLEFTTESLIEYSYSCATPIEIVELK